jgi:hypothetical protein
MKITCNVMNKTLPYYTDPQQTPTCYPRLVAGN